MVTLTPEGLVRAEVSLVRDAVDCYALPQSPDLRLVRLL